MKTYTVLLANVSIKAESNGFVFIIFVPPILYALGRARAEETEAHTRNFSSR